MNYIFFDIECANCFDGAGKICEFGYVITDESFETLEKEVLFINPSAPFDWYVLKNMLAYPKDFYCAAETYPVAFPKIQKLFNMKDTCIIGHTVDADAGYLNDEARRFGLPFFNYEFFDAKEMFAEYASSAKSLGLESIGEALGSEGPKHAHLSVDDAEATRNIVKFMCQAIGMTLDELISLCPNAVGNTKNGVVWTPIRESAEEKRKEEFQKTVSLNRIEKAVAKKYVKFRDSLPINMSSDSSLRGKSVCFSRNYEDSHLKEMMLLTKRLAEFGAKCVGKASTCNIFIKPNDVIENEEELSCMRFQCVVQEIANGAHIEIWSMEQLLDAINLSLEELNNCLIPTEEDFFPKKRYSFDKKTGSTIGEILKSSGVDLYALIK